MTVTTTLNEIRSFNPCAAGWLCVRKAHAHKGEDAILTIADCAESNSLSDLLWLLGKKRETAIIVQFAKWCADSVAHIDNKAARRARRHADADADADAAADAAAGAYAAYAADAAGAAADAYAAAAYAAADAYAAAAYTADAAFKQARAAQRAKLIELCA